MSSSLEAVVRGLEPECLHSDDVLRALEEIVRVAKVAEAGRAVLARVVDERGLHRRSGHLSAAHLLAAASGSTVGAAAAAIETGRRMSEQSELDAAFRAGEVSLEQTVVISDAVAADSSAERSLLEAARHEGLSGMRVKARAVKAAADEDRFGRYERQLRGSSFRHGMDHRDGMVWGQFRLPPDDGAAVVNRIERETDRVFRRAHAAGRRDSHDRYAAEALVAIVTGALAPESRMGTGAEVVAIVSAEALRRGRLVDDEVCAIPGFGDIPLEVPRRMLEEDAFLAGVLHDGERVQVVKRFGRYRSAAVRDALLVEHVLAHGHVVCSEAGCDRTDIEWDHTVPVAEGGTSATTNQKPLCRGHHRQKTLRENQARRRQRARTRNRAKTIDIDQGPAP